MSSEKRSFSRVPVRLKAHARQAHALDSPRLFQSHAQPMQADLRGGKLPEEVTGFLQEMDRKLDTILGLLSREHLRDDFPLNLEVIEISGAGMKFSTSENVRAGDLLEVVIVLDRVPLRLAGSKGKVIDGDQSSGVHRFEFVNMNENDLEMIIQFVFQRQREEIRSSRRT
jgi:hypothetical protein